MTFNSASLGALILCISIAGHAADRSVLATTVAEEFVQALQHQHFEQAAALFSEEVPRSGMATASMLKRINDRVGGFATMKAVPTLPNGKSLGLEFPAHRTIPPGVLKFFQVRYAATAADGKPVFFELNVADDNTPPHILSLGVRFPVSDAQSAKRATDLVSYIHR